MHYELKLITIILNGKYPSLIERLASRIWMDARITYLFMSSTTKEYVIISSFCELLYTSRQAKIVHSGAFYLIFLPKIIFLVRRKLSLFRVPGIYMS